MDIRKIRLEGVNWNQRAQAKDWQQAFVNTVMNLLVQ